MTFNVQSIEVHFFMFIAVIEFEFDVIYVKVFEMIFKNIMSYCYLNIIVSRK